TFDLASSSGCAETEGAGTPPTTAPAAAMSEIVFASTGAGGGGGGGATALEAMNPSTTPGRASVVGLEPATKLPRTPRCAFFNCGSALRADAAAMTRAGELAVLGFAALVSDFASVWAPSEFCSISACAAGGTDF